MVICIYSKNLVPSSSHIKDHFEKSSASMGCCHVLMKLMILQEELSMPTFFQMFQFNNPFL